MSIIDKLVAITKAAGEQMAAAAPPPPAAPDAGAEGAGSPSDALGQLIAAMTDVKGKMDAGQDPAACMEELRAIVASAGELTGDGGATDMEEQAEPGVDPTQGTFSPVAMSYQRMNAAQFIEYVANQSSQIADACKKGLPDGPLRLRALKATYAAVGVFDDSPDNGLPTGHIPTYVSPYAPDGKTKVLGMSVTNNTNQPQVFDGSRPSAPAAPKSKQKQLGVMNAFGMSANDKNVLTDHVAKMADAVKGAAAAIEKALCDPADEKPKAEVAPVKKEDGGDDEETTKGVWTTAYVNALPNTAFLYSKGDQRHLPYKNAEGQVDLPHLRNALARLPETNIPAATKDRLAARARHILESKGGEQISKSVRVPDINLPEVGKPSQDWSKLFPAG